jgi:metal-responsive CopG/Arc/MetJ family transcriptional regulator
MQLKNTIGREKVSRKKIYTTIGLSSELVQKLDETAAKESRSRSSLIQVILLGWLEGKKESAAK